MTDRISHKQAAGLGWRRVDPKPWEKTAARWEGPEGWFLEHCGHPTAIWPWALYDPQGLLVDYHGRGWHSLAAAMTFVALKTRET